MNMIRPARNIFITAIIAFNFLVLITSPDPVDASQADQELAMHNAIMDMYQKFVPKIDGVDIVPPNLATELGNLDRYAQEYVRSFQATIPVQNKLRDLPAHHTMKRKKRLDEVNQAINDITRLHAKYSELAKKLEYKRDKLIIINAGKLLADYAALPDSGIAFLTDRFMAAITGSVQFVPEGGLGSTSASRRLKNINLELDQAHKDLHKTLYTEPANPDELFKLTRQGELQAERCQRLAYELQQKMRTQTRPDLVGAENKVEQNIAKVIKDIDRILATSPPIAQCLIRPVQIDLTQAKPQQQLNVFYLYSSGLEKPAKQGDITFRSRDSIVSVNQQGMVTGHKAGSTEVIAELKGSGKKCSVPVTMTFPPAPGKQVTVPDLYWMDQATAEKEIQKAGLVASVNTAPKADHSLPYDTVVRQRPRAKSKVTIGSTVWVTMNRQPAYPALAELLGVKIVKASPPYQVNTEYSMLAVTANLNPNGRYVWWWKVDGESLGNGKTMEHTFQKGGVHIVEVEMMNIVDRRESYDLTERIYIEIPVPKDYTVDFGLSPKLEKGKTYIAGDTLTFTEKCKDIPNITEYRWYVNGNYIGSGSRISHQFKEKGNYDVTLGIGRGSNFDELEQTKSITIGEQSIGKLGAKRNRFKAKGGSANLSVCSEYWVGGIGDWSSKCTQFSTIGPVDGYGLCTGDQADGYNSGFLAYSKKDSKDLNFQVYHFRFDDWKGRIRYSGKIPRAFNPDPDSISITCQQRAATVKWTNENGSNCSTRIWKFKSSDFLAYSGVESPTCSTATISPKKMKQCDKFAKKAVEQFKENQKECNLTTPEWHDREADHKQWCLDVSDKEAEDLSAHRDNALKTCAKAKSWCDSYAKRAVEQSEENSRNQCGFKGNRWGSNYDAHFNWCTNKSRKSADSETQKRDKDLRNCTSKREGPCNQYADKAVKQNRKSNEQDCGFCGRRWQSSYKNHFNWCLAQPYSTRDSETKAREKLLKQCGSASSSDKRTFYEPCYNDYRLDNCLNFGTNCKKPAADRFCIEKGYTEATEWDRLEKVRPTYIIDDRNLCDEEACTGFSQITCSGNTHPDNQDPTCTIKRPKSGDVIPTGKNIRVSADAKDHDYTGYRLDNLEYDWVFEGGIPDKWNSYQGDATVKWKTPGTYTASLTVTDDKGGTCTDTVAITVQDKGAPFDCDQYADKSVMQNEENLSRKCGFTSDLWHSGKSGHTNWCRNNDQSKATRNIELRQKALNDCKGAGAVTSKQLVCEITAPEKIVFIDAGKTVNFAGNAVSPDGNRISYNWKFGEYGANPATSNKQKPGKVVFKYGGNYTTTLTVTDSGGQTCKDTRQVLVYDSNDPREFCEGYSDISREQQKTNLQNSCGLSGTHWHNDEIKHRDWCTSVPLDQARNGLASRDEKLRQCTGNTTSGSTGGMTPPKTGDGSAGTESTSGGTKKQQVTGTALANRLGSDSYKVTVNAGTIYKSDWNLNVNNGHISGNSEWTCCPGKRTDPMNGSIINDTVRIERDCTGQGNNQQCLQVYTGQMKGDVIQGNFTHNGRGAGSWTLYLNKPETGGSTGSGGGSGGSSGGGGIRVVSATYGSNCGVANGNVTSHIAKQCNGKSECRYTVDHRIIGDPAYGCAKTYSVKYQCGNSSRVVKKSLEAEAGLGGKAVLLECVGSSFVPESSIGLSGKWTVNQHNGYTGKMDLQQNSAGTLTGSVTWNGNLFGTIKGTVSGNDIEFTVSYSGGVTGHYKGTVTQGGAKMVNGTTKASNGASATWDAVLNQSASSNNKKKSDSPSGDADTGWQTTQKGPLSTINPKAHQWSTSGGGFMVMNGSYRFDKSWYRRTWGEKDPFYSDGESTKQPPRHSHAEVMKHAIIKLGKVTARGPGHFALFGRVKGPGAWVKLYDKARNRFHPGSGGDLTMYRSNSFAWKNGGWVGSWSGKWTGTVNDLDGNKPMGGWVPANKIVTYDIELDQGWYNNMNVPFGSMGFSAPQEIDYELWFFPREGGGVKFEKYPQSATHSGSSSTIESLPPAQESMKVITGYGKKTK